MAKAKKRSDGLYQKQITIGRNADGSYKRKTVYGKTQKELDAKISELLHQISIGIRIDDDSTFSEVADIWIKNYRVVNNTAWAQTQERITRQHLIPYLGNIKVKQLTKFDLQSLMNIMRDNGLSTSTMKKVRDIAAQIIEVAVDKKIVLTNPFKGVTVAEIAPKERRALTEEEIDRITRTWKGHRMGHAAMVMLFCGLRRGEIVALDWSDFDFTAKVIHVTKSVIFDKNQPVIKGPKSKAGIRDVPLPDFLITMLKGLHKESTVFLTSQQGERMTLTAYMRAWSSYEHYLNIQAGGHDGSRSRKKLVAVDHITAHMLRHTYASLLYEAGVDLKSAQRILGHSDIETTMEIYTHLTKKKEAQAIDSINRHFESTYIHKKPKVKERDDER